MPSPSEWMQFGPFVGLVAALAYGAWVIIPKALNLHETVISKLATDSREAMEKMASDHKATVDGLVMEFRSELRDQREWQERELEKRDAAFGKIADAVDRVGRDK